MRLADVLPYASGSLSQPRVASRSEVLVFVESIRERFPRPNVEDAPWALPATDADAGRDIAALPLAVEAAKLRPTAKE